MPAIEVQRLEKSFGKFRALRGVSFTIREGSVAGFVGPNGAGKTTTIKSTATFVRPDRGSIKLLGKDPFKDKRVFSEVSFVFSKLSYPPTDTVKEYLEDMVNVFGETLLKWSRSPASSPTRQEAGRALLWTRREGPAGWRPDKGAQAHNH